MFVSAFRLAGGGGQGAEDGEHRVEVRQSRAEAVDEVGQGEVAVDQVLVVLGDVVDQLAHQGGVDLFELAERVATLVDHLVMPGLPALELGHLARSLVAGDLGGLSRQLQLLLLVLEDQLLDLQRLRLDLDQRMKQVNRIVIRVRGRCRGRRLAGGGYFHPVRP